MKLEPFLPDISAALLLAFLNWLILSAGGIEWGTEGAGVLVALSCAVFLMFVVIRRIQP